MVNCCLLLLLLPFTVAVIVAVVDSMFLCMLLCHYVIVLTVVAETNRGADLRTIFSRWQCEAYFEAEQHAALHCSSLTPVGQLDTCVH